ncbi:hypothetical protein ACWPKS_00910 [Coraliomargarita sp. W4R72]
MSENKNTSKRIETRGASVPKPSGRVTNFGSNVPKPTPQAVAQSQTQSGTPKKTGS